MRPRPPAIDARELRVRRQCNAGRQRREQDKRAAVEWQLDFTQLPTAKNFLAFNANFGINHAA